MLQSLDHKRLKPLAVPLPDLQDCSELNVHKQLCEVTLLLVSIGVDFLSQVSNLHEVVCRPIPREIGKVQVQIDVPLGRQESIFVAEDILSENIKL